MTTPQGMLELADELDGIVSALKMGGKGNEVWMANSDAPTIQRAAAALRLSASPAGNGGRAVEVDIGAAMAALQASPELCEMMNEMVGGPALVEAQAEIERLNAIIALTPAVAPDGAREGYFRGDDRDENGNLTTLKQHRGKAARDRSHARTLELIALALKQSYSDVMRDGKSVSVFNESVALETIAAIFSASSALPAVVGIEEREALETLTKAYHAEFKKLGEMQSDKSIDGVSRNWQGGKVNGLGDARMILQDALARHPHQPVEDWPPQFEPMKLQARPPEGGDWTDIFPAQLEWMAKNGNDVRALAHPLEPATEAENK